MSWERRTALAAFSGGASFSNSGGFGNSASFGSGASFSKQRRPQRAP